MPVARSLALTALVALAAPPAGADQDRARALFVHGEEAFEAGRFAEAAIAFDQAFAESHKPGLLWNLAQAYRRQYDVDHDVSVLRRAAIVFGHYGEVAENPRDRKEAIDAREALTARISLIEANEAAARDSEAGRPRWPGLATGGAGVAVLVAGLTFGLLARSAAADVEAAAALQPKVPFSSYADEEARGKAFELASFVLYGVGAAALAAGVVLAVLHPRLKRGRSAGLAPSLGGGRFAVSF